MLRKILEEFFNSTYKYNLDEHIDDAMKKIEALLPEKMLTKDYESVFYNSKKKGFNKAIDQVKERLFN